MRKPQLSNRLRGYLKTRNKPSLLASALVLISGGAVASFGVQKLIDSFNAWFSSGILWGPAVNSFLGNVVVAFILILPSLLVFIVGYLLLESHSLGPKLSILLSVAVTALAVLGTINLELGLAAGFLCAAATAIEFIRLKRTTEHKPDPAAVTENIAKFGLRLSGLSVTAILIGMIVYIGARGINYITWDFVVGGDWNWPYAAQVASGIIDAPMPGISAFIIGSMLIVGFCELIAIPLGLGAAIYLSEYAPENAITNTIRLFIEVLAGVPSIVLGLVGFSIFVTQLGIGYSLIGGGLSLAFMILPWNIRVAEEAIRAVPQSYREAAYAVGATKWQTIRNMVVLSSSPGIITGILLGVGGAIGESAVLLLTAGAEGATQLPAGILTGAMPSLAVWSFIAYKSLFYKGGGGGEGAMRAWEAQNAGFAGAFVLIVIFLVITVIALVARNYLSKKISGQ
jgi:phosphate transport system permease protein